MSDKRYWIFTFGWGQQHQGKYVKIYAESDGEARDKMFAKYGEKWAQQYSAEQWKGMLNDPNRMYPMETELEVIP